MDNQNEMIEEGEIQEPQKMEQEERDQPEKSLQSANQPLGQPGPNKKVDLITMLKQNPLRYKYLKESLKFFTLIKKNHYLDRKRKNPKNDEIESCICRPRGHDSKAPEYTNVSYNCEERCLNRMISTECDDQTCNCGDLCQNRKFQKHQYANVYPFPAGGKGWGLKAGELIRTGQFIMQYIGEIFSTASEVGKMRVKQYSSSACTYLMKTSNREVIDPTYKGNLARFINHSCQPNCITRKWNVLGEICIGIFATRDIKEDEELTFDYHFDVYSTPLTKCLCGAKKCKGYLGLRPTDMDVDLWTDRLQNMICLICSNTYDDDDVKLIICDSCNEGFHIFCLDPPLEDIPQESFFCKECLDKREVEKQRADKERKQIMRAKKLEQMQNAKNKEASESSDDGIVPSNQKYERMYRFIKKVEEKAVNRMMEEEEEELNEVKNNTPQKKGQVSNKTGATNNKRKDELYELNKKAIDKFQVYIQKHNDLLQRINNFERKKQKQNQNQRKSMLFNKIQIHLILKSNYILVQKIGAQIYLDIHHKNSTDYFLKSTEVTIIGNDSQIKIFQEIIEITNEIISELQVEMGITEAYIPIPALYIKRLIGPGHFGINQIQKTHQVAMHYHRRFANQECYPLEATCKLLIKGGKDNIMRAYEDIKKRISALEVERIYLNPYEIKTIVNSMVNLKKKTGMAEFRISREVPFKEVNHPFYYIQQKNKQITIIGTRAEIDKTKKEIMSFFEEPNRKQEYNYNISLFLAQSNHKSSLLGIKNQLERQIPSIKMMIFDSTPPRKNMTLSFLGTRENRQKAKQYLFRKLEQQNKEGKISVNLEHFQDQMNYQMTKYYFKYMQNAMLTKDTAFMKSWDILNSYYYDGEPNYMWKSVKKSLMMDSETLLYACFVLKQNIIRKIQTENDSSLTLLEEVFRIIKENMSRILNIYNVNNTPALKNYQSLIDSEEARRIFRDSYSHVQFIKSEDSRMVQERDDGSDHRPKQKQWSFFQRKVFKKNKNLLKLLEQEYTRSREKEDDRRRDKWK